MKYLVLKINLKIIDYSGVSGNKLSILILSSALSNNIEYYVSIMVVIITFLVVKI